MFSQETVNNYFDKRSRHSGRLIGETLDDICEGRCSVYDLPTIRVMKRDGKWVTADNRRLWVFRQLERLGKCDEVPVHETFYINPDKLNSSNGGISVRVRRYAGGRWHNKPTVSNTNKKQECILANSSSLNKTPYDSQRHVIARPSYSTESLKGNSVSNMYGRTGENSSNSSNYHSTVASSAATKPTIEALDHKTQRQMPAFDNPSFPYHGPSNTSNIRSMYGKAGHTSNQYLPSLTRGSAIGPLSSEIPRPAYVRDGPAAHTIAEPQQSIPERNSDTIHNKVLDGQSSAAESISEYDRETQRQVTETTYISETRSTTPTSSYTPSTQVWNSSDNTRNEQWSNIQRASSSYSRNAGVFARTSEQEEIPYRSTTLGQTANRGPESVRVNFYDDEDTSTDKQCCVIL